MPRWFEAERVFIEACRAGTPLEEPRGEKPCSRCKEVKPLNQFHRVSANKDGRDYVCAACINSQRHKKKTPPVPASGVSSSRKEDHDVPGNTQGDL